MERNEFDPVDFLATTGIGRKIIQIEAKQPIFSQGDPADAAFYIQSGRARLTVVSKVGKEANVMLLAAGDFTGEEAIAPTPGLRLATAVALTHCTVLKIECYEMVRAIHEERRFSDLFVAFLLKRSMRIQADLVDHLFNSSEKRLARALLLMADFDMLGEPETLIPRITQEALAGIVGTTRSRVSFFMNRFRTLGFIKYNSRIRVHRSLVNVLLHDD